MISVKNKRELQAMREACVISARALKLAGEAVQPGVTTAEIDREVRRYIESTGAKPSFLGYGGFPASACISVNNVVIHGIPDKRVIKAGDIVSVDVGAFYNGYHGDNAATFAAGEVSPEAQALMDPPAKAFTKALKRRRRAIGSAISVRLSSGMSRCAVTRLYGSLSATE